jgi:phosphopantetheinyl transferase
VGIDIEIVHPRIAKVAHKFLNDAEKAMIASLPEDKQLNQLAFCWAAKEAMYKKHEQLGIDFAKDFNLPVLALEDRGLVAAQILHKGHDQTVQLDYHFGADYICVTCIS